MQARFANLIGVVAIILTLLSAAPAGAAPTPILCLLATPGGQAPAGPAPAASAPNTPAVTIAAYPGQAYIHVSTTNNTVCNSTDLDNAWLNGQPNTRFLVTSNSLAYGNSGLALPVQQGVWYDTAAHRGAIYNEDGPGDALPAGLAWNVFIPPQDGTLILQDSTALNSTGPNTRIDDPQFNGDPTAVIFVQHVYNPGALPLGAPVNSYTATVGVTYDVGHGQWAIHNEDGSTFPFGKTFYVLRASPDETFFTHTVTLANRVTPAFTVLNYPALNGNPDAQVLVTQNFDAGVANNHPVGVGYSVPLQRWTIFNSDLITVPVGAMFNVLVIPPKHGFFLHTATTANTTLNATALDNPDLNGNPDALVYVSHDWNPPESNNEIYNDHPIGVEYLGTSWYIMNVDGAPMPDGITFNVYYTWPRGNSFSVSASSTNTSASSMTLNSPLLNSRPNAVPIATFNETPAGRPGGNYTPTVGLRYYSPLTAWQIFNLSGPTFNITQTYNVLVAPTSFVVTSTATLDNWFEFSNPLTDNNPAALVFASPRDNGGINPANVGVWYDTDTNLWSIFNEDTSIAMPAGSVYDVFAIPRGRILAPVVTK